MLANGKSLFTIKHKGIIHVGLMKNRNKIAVIQTESEEIMTGGNSVFLL